MENIDYSKYPSWKAVTAPTGAVYYKIPGTGYLYDPFLSSSKGRPVLWTDPTAALDDKKKAEDAAKDAASPINQLVPVAGAVAGTVGTAYLMNQMAAPSAAAAAPTVAAATPTFTAAAPTIATGGGGAAYGGGTAAAGSSVAATGVTPAASGTAAGTTAGSAFMGTALPITAAATGAYLAGRYQKAVLEGDDEYQKSNQGKAGRAQLAFTTGGLSEIGNYAGRKFGLFGGDKWKSEGNKLQALQEQGTYVPEGAYTSAMSGPKSKEELIKIAQETGGNVAFAGSRKESDLTPTDIVGYAAFAEQDPDWFKKPIEERLKVADQALQAGAVREKHGSIDVDWSKVPVIQAAPPPNTAIPAPGAPVAAPGVQVLKPPTKDQQLGIELAKTINMKNKNK